MVVCVLALLQFHVLADWAAREAAHQAGRKALQGQWAVVVWDSEGAWLSAEPGAIGDGYRESVVVFAGDRVRVKPRGRDGWSFLGSKWVWEGAYRVNPAREPQEIDITVMAWPLGADGEGTLTDTVWRGIYTLRGHRLTICLDRSKPSKRPAGFAIKADGPDLMLLLERTKNDRKSR
jgi:uncharacterized protein (TIGR03067 family)